MNTITLVVPYYDNPEMLKFQLQNWKSWPAHLVDRTEIIVVDDCSPRFPARHQIHTPPPNFRLYRVCQDVCWNWIACRNIGVKEAFGKWLLLTDIDHVVDQRLLQYLHDFDAEEHCFYVPTRVDGPERKPNPKPHPNSYFMTKELFWKIGGYDESYSGHYGTDGIWRRRCQQVAQRKEIPVPLIQYLPEHIGDCRTQTLERKSEVQRNAVLALTEAKKARGEEFFIKTLSFPYERLI